MADPQPIEPVAKEFVDCILSDWNGDLGLSPEVLRKLVPAGLDVIDLLHVVENGIVTHLLKESPHETFFEKTGPIETGSLRITMSFNPHLDGLTIVGFERL